MSDIVKISIVDDDPSAREGTKDLVRAFGFDVEAFQSGKEFLASDRVRSTSCLIADVRMPEMTGLELYERLVELGNTIPTILMTAYADDGDYARARRAGVIFYMVKPFDDQELLSSILSAIGGRTDGGPEQ